MLLTLIHCEKSQDDQKLKNIQNEESYYDDDADEDSREGKLTALQFF